MNLRVTGLLLAVAIILGGGVYYLMQQPSPADQQAKAKTPAIFNIPETSIAKITLTSAGKSTVLQQTNNTWQVTAPTTGPADDLQVGGFVSQISTLSATDVIPNVTDLGQYGLQPAKADVIVNTTDGKSYELNLGNATVDGASYYARQPNQGTVYLVPAALGQQAEQFVTTPPIATPTPTPPPGTPGAAPSGVPAAPPIGTPAAAPTAQLSGTPSG